MCGDTSWGLDFIKPSLYVLLEGHNVVKLRKEDGYVQVGSDPGRAQGPRAQCDVLMGSRNGGRSLDNTPFLLLF